MSTNCTGEVEESDLFIVAAIRVSTAFISSVISGIILASVSIRLDKSQLVHRLLIYLTIATLTAQLADVLQILSVFCSVPWHTPTCTFVGFATQFSSWLLLLVGLWLASVLSLRYWSPNYREALSVKRDVGTWVGIVVASSLIAAIPLWTGGYGMNQARCWLEGTRFIEQWLLWYGWTVVAPAVAIVTVTTALCRSEKRQQQYYESSRGISTTSRERLKAASKKLKRLILYMALYWALVTVAIILHNVPQVKDAMPFLVAMAIAVPLGVLLTLTMIILHFYEHRRPTTHSTDFQLLSSEGSLTINRGGLAGRRKMKNVSREAEDTADRQEELRESLLLTLEMSDEYNFTQH